jgi:hypothetical protein
MRLAGQFSDVAALDDAPNRDLLLARRSVESAPGGIMSAVSNVAAELDRNSG